MKEKTKCPECGGTNWKLSYLIDFYLEPPEMTYKCVRCGFKINSRENREKIEKEKLNV